MEKYTLKNGKTITIGDGSFISAAEHEEIERIKAEPKHESLIERVGHDLKEGAEKIAETAAEVAFSGLGAMQDQ